MRLGFPPLPVGEGRGEGNRAHPIPAARRLSPMRRCFVGWRSAYPTYGPCGLPLIYPLAATETAGFPPLPVGEGRGEGNRAHPVPAARRLSPMRRCFVGWRFAYPTYGPCGLPLIYPLAATETAGFPPLPVGEGRGEGNRAHPIPAARRLSPMRRCFVGWRFAYPTYDSCDLSLIYPLAATETAGFPPLPVYEEPE
ncbi:Uncharacterised protein [Klebsiella variicola]|nr:Uncharacterised protein [Klebsiella variicola]